MKKVSQIVAKASLKAAEKAVSKASDWFIFQVKEPKNLKKMIKK